VTDSMSGFFAVRVGALDGVELRPHGFKILLEVLARTPQLRIAEVPFTFGERGAGESKASMAEGVRFVRHLLRLRLSVLTGSRVGRVLSFGAVGVSGIAVNAGAFWAATAVGMHYLWAAVAATQASTLWNFAGTDLMVFSGRKRRGLLSRLLPFAVVNEVLLLARLPLLAFLVATIGIMPLVANVTTLLLTFVLRFAFSERLFTSERPS
jgi:dolichol-phosphate mannosyltransferase